MKASRLFHCILMIVICPLNSEGKSLMFDSSSFILPHQTPLPIFVFGDSHSKAFEGIFGCRVNHIGPITMHRIGRDGLQILDIRNHGVTNGAMAIFIFGEIDVRCHIGKQRDEKERDLDEIIDTLAQNYIRTILENYSLYESLHIVVCSVTPPSDFAFNPDYPRYGLIEERTLISQKLNKALATLCNAYNIEFLDVYDHYAAPDGSLRFEISDRNVHIRADCNQEIREKLWEIAKKKNLK